MIYNKKRSDENRTFCFGDLSKLGDMPDVYFELENANFIKLGSYNRDCIIWDVFAHRDLCIIATFLRNNGVFTGKIFVKHNRYIRRVNLPKYAGVYVMDYYPGFTRKLYKEYVDGLGEGIIVLDDGSLQSFLVENCSILSINYIDLMMAYNYYKSLEISLVLNQLSSSKLSKYIKCKDISRTVERIKELYSDIPVSTKLKYKCDLYFIRDSLTKAYGVKFYSPIDYFLKLKGKIYEKF